MDYKLDGYCGLFCGACEILRANRNNTIEQVAELWNMPVDKLRCHGCKSSVTAFYCNDCTIKQCAEAKGVEYCFQCEEFICSRLKAFRSDGCPHHATIMQSLDLMKRLGPERWLNEQIARWTCQACGASLCWYDKACTRCGTPVPNLTFEDADIAEV